MTSIREAVYVRSATLLVFALCTPLLAHLMGFSKEWEFSIGLLAIGVSALLSILLEQRFLPSTFRGRQMRRHMASAAEAARETKALGLVLEQLKRELEQDLTRLESGTYRGRVDKIPMLSIETVKAVRRSARATFIVDEREKQYENSTGTSYLNEWFDRARRFAEAGDYPMQRIFIVENKQSVTAEVMHQIEEHLERKVDIFVVERAEAERLSQNLELDFGLFDENCLMTVTQETERSSLLSLYVKLPSGSNVEYMRAYEDFWTRLMYARGTIKGTELLRQFQAPLNATFWTNKFYLDSTSLTPPHGLSSADADRMVQMVLDAHPHESAVAVAVLGMTPQLVEACLRQAKIVKIVPIDQAEIDQIWTSPRIEQQSQKNWLNYVPPLAFQGVLGDEALNNLTITQYEGFFRNMARMLQPGSLLVLRTMGLYQNADHFLHLSPVDLLAEIKTRHLHTSDSERNARILEYLHSPDIAFNQRDKTLETVRYNNLISTWVRDGQITSVDAEKFWFPSREHQKLILTSPETSDLQSASENFFRTRQFESVDISYCGHDKELANLYRITPFVRRA